MTDLHHEHHRCEWKYQPVRYPFSGREIGSIKGIPQTRVHGALQEKPAPAKETDTS
ncbi:MAG: hypothetical protein OSA95_06045 [Opitutales bacterium]|nr:hypothetical protein [Opitutales bacterium]